MSLSIFSTATITKREIFLKELVGDYGVVKRDEWNNNNSTIKRNAYIVDVKNIKKDVTDIFLRIYNYNRTSGETPINIVPVAGWDTSHSQTSDESFATYLLEKEYAQSFSFERTVDQNTDIILRIAKSAMKMKIIKKGNEYFLRATANTRIRDADEFLHNEGYAFPPNMTTIHTISLGGSATGPFGPSKNLGSLTTNIVAMKVISPLSKSMTLSADENSELFRVLRDCHLGMCFFVRNLTLKIEPQYFLKKHTTLYHNMNDYTEAMLKKNAIEEDHFITMYIPVNISETNNESYRFKVTTYEKTDLFPTNSLTQPEKDLADCIQLVKTEIGEPLINLITSSKKLHKFLPLIHDQVVNFEYGPNKESSEIDLSHRIAHPLNTYTDAKLRDICPFIMVENYADALKIKLEIFNYTEIKLKVLAKNKNYPILNAYVRFTRGVPDPKGEGGIAPTAVDNESQGILAFEYLTYSNLAETDAYRELENGLYSYLRQCGRKINFHPGKHLPFHMKSLNEILTDEIGKKRQKNFLEAFYKCHEGEENVQFSPLATPEKKEFVGYEKDMSIKETVAHHEISPEKQKEALKSIIPIAQKYNNVEAEQKAVKALEKLEKRNL